MSHETPTLSPVARSWAAAVVVAALALALGGGAFRAFRPERTPVTPADTPLPVCLEPDGELAEPPTVFRWEPGGEDVDLSQVQVYNDRRELYWQSAPVTGHEIAIDPESVFATGVAGRVYFWVVREVSDGRPRASSAVARFVFTKDVHGRGIGESPPQAEPFDQ